MVQDYGRQAPAAEPQENSFEDLLALQVAWSILGEPEMDALFARRARVLEDLYAAVSSFVTDSAVYDGTPREDKYRTVFLRHRLPVLQELVQRLDSLDPAAYSEDW